MKRGKENNLPSCNADVVVIGGGPGGSAAAITCAQAGLRVALVEREAFPREHVGESLHPGIEPLLKQLGVAERVSAACFLRYEGHRVEWGGERRYEVFGSDVTGAWRGFQAWRAQFDAILLDRAREVGVTILQPCRAIRPAVSGRRVVGVHTSQGLLSAPFVIDAAGAPHWLARHLKLAVEVFSPRLIAQYGYAEGDCLFADDSPALVSNETGWMWTARIRPGLYQWVRLSLNAEERDHHLLLPDEFQRLKSKGTLRKADVTWRIVGRCAGPGYFLTGDAASVLDPASSHGVLKAIMSGQFAAHLIARVSEGDSNERLAARVYQDWLRRWFFHDVKRMRDLYAIFMRAGPP